MRKIFLPILLFCFYAASSQTVQTVITVPITTSGLSGTTEQALLYLPSDYATSGSKKYPLLFFGHGAGEAADGGSAGTGLAKIYNQATSGGPAYFIEHSQWPSTFTNPATGVQEQFIIVTPQAADWNISGDAFANIVNYIMANYRADSLRIHFMGISAGGATAVDYAAQMDPNEDPPSVGTNPRRWKLATIVPLSPATNAVQQSWANVIVADSIRGWQLGDPNNDPFGDVSFDLNADMNTAKAGFSRGTFNPPFTFGHGGWSHFTVPTYTETFAWRGVASTPMSIYQFMLINVRVGASTTNPSCSAGSNQSITQPTSTATLSGTAASGTGQTITGYVWSQTGGTATTITTPTNGTTGGSTGTTTTGVTGLTTVGTYTYLLTVTQSGGLTATSSVTVTVNSNAPVANAGGDQTISLPATSTTINGTGSTGTITSYSWTELSGPNSATITNGTTSIATVSNLLQGSYVFKLSLNGGVSTATVNVIVNPVPGPCHGTRKYLTPDPGDSSVFMTTTTNPSTLQFVPGDTIAFKSSVGYGSIELHYIKGSPGCPIVFTNEGGQAWIKGFFKIYGAKYVHFDGSGSPDHYGFKIQFDPNNITGDFRNGVGLQITELSKVVEINNVFINHTIFGMPIKQSPGCPDSVNYPNWVMDSITVHDCYIRQVGLEGVYDGDTSPDNSPTSSDPRPVHCAIGPNPDSVIYPRPIRSSHHSFFNNIIDSTERGGIQISGHSGSIAQVYNNTVRHSGLDGDEQQGTGISLGGYTRAYVHDNIISTNTTWGFASLGASGTNIPLRVENNTFDSIGYSNHYSNVTDTLFPITPTTPMFGPGSGIPAGNNYDFAVPIFIKSTNHQDPDSLQFWVKSNTMGKWRAENIKTFPSDSSAIQVFDFSSPVSIQKQGNFMCLNVRSAGGPVSFYVDQTITTIPFTSSCPLVPPLCPCIPVPTGFIIKLH